MHDRAMPIVPPLHRGRMAAAVLACALVLGACGGDSAPALIAAGKESLAKKDPRTALIQFKSALQKEPDSAEARYLLGQALLDAGDPFSAVVELTKALDQRHDDNQVMPALGRALLMAGGAKKLTTLYGAVTLSDKTANAALKSSVANAWGVLGDKPRAIEALSAAAASVPDYPAVLILQARMKADERQFDAALAMVEQVLARNGAHAEALHLKGEILLHARNDTAGGEAAFTQALAAEPAYIASHLALISLRLRAGDIPGAKAQAAKLHALLPRHPQTLFIDARLALLDKDLKKARELTQQLLRIAPDNIGVLQLAGTVEGMSGQLVVAESHYAKALQLEPGLIGARRSLAKVHLRQGQAVKALATLAPVIDGKQTPDAESLAVAGEAQLQLGDARAAELLFLRAAKLAPEDPKLRTALALMTMSRGDASAAFSQLEAISAQTQDTASDLAIVSARLKRKEYPAALQALDVVARKQPQSATVPELRGSVFVAQRDYAAARQAYEQALALEPSRFSAVYSLATLDVLEGKPEQAQQRLDKVIANDPRNHVARMTLASLQQRQSLPLATIQKTLADGIQAEPTEPAPRLQLIELLLQRKQYKEALSVAQEARAALPNDANVLDAVGRAQSLAGDTQQALSTFRQLASVETRSARAQLRIADLMKSTGNREGAVSALRRALEIEPSNDAAQVRLMDLLITDGKPKDALEMARSMQQRMPAVATGYLLEGAIHQRLKATDAAIAAYRNGIAKAAASSELAVALHKALVLRGSTAEADRFAADWMKQQPSDVQFEYHLATIAILRNELDRAETLLTHVLSLLPNHPMALNNLAWVMATRGKPGALIHAQRAVDLLPNRPALLDTLALALAADKQLPKALEAQRKAIEIAPGDMGLRLNLAKLAIQAGDKALARSELERLSAQGTKLAYHAEVSRLLKTL